MGILAIGTRALGYTLIPGIIVGSLSYFGGKSVATKEFDIVKQGLEHEINVLTTQVVQDTETFVSIDRKAEDIQKQYEEMQKELRKKVKNG